MLDVRLGSLFLLCVQKDSLCFFGQLTEGVTAHTAKFHPAKEILAFAPFASI